MIDPFMLTELVSYKICERYDDTLIKDKYININKVGYDNHLAVM